MHNFASDTIRIALCQDLVGGKEMKKMKKFAIVLFLCVATFTQMQAGDSVGNTSVSINETNFPDAAFREYVSSLYDNINHDGMLDEGEISGAMSMFVFGGTFTSLKGIEFFTALQLLYLAETQIDSLDLTKCETLTNLDCYDNHKLTALNVSGCKALTELNCTGGRLASLDISELTSLTLLNCNANQLAHLDVTHNEKLTKLYCSSNQLTDLDVTHNEELTELYCSGNLLTELDVSQNKELKSLYCSDNHLASLDFSENAKLTNVYCSTNRISESQMGVLVESLPVVLAGYLQVTNIVDSKEKNVINSEQAATANAKGWFVFDNSGKFYGVDPTVSSRRDFTARSVEGVEMWFTITSEEEKTCQVKANHAISKLTEGHVTIPSEANGYTVTEIGQSAFHECTNMTGISIPETVTSIADAAFSSCSGLTSVTLPNSVREIGSEVFFDCSALTSVVLSDGMYKISSALFMGCSSLTSVVIPEGVSTIEGCAFASCCALTSVSIPDWVGTIEGLAFENCVSLTSVSLPSRLNLLGNGAFHNCISLASITIPDEVYRLDSYTFGGCSNLATVTLGSGVGLVENNTFSDCNALTDFYCLAEDVPMTGEKAFESSDISRATLHVASSAIEAYKVSKPWSDFGAIVTSESDIREAKVSAAVNEVPLYTLGGVRVTQPKKGIYLKGMKKVVYH